MTITIEKWKDGNLYAVERDKNGHFVKGSIRTQIRISQKFKDRGVKTKSTDRRYEPETFKPKDYMFRLSMAINNVPLHKKYLSFLIQGFSQDKNFLEQKRNDLKKKLIALANNWLGYSYNALAEWNSFNYYIATEQPTEIIIDKSVLNLWIFFVEEKGGVKFTTRGSLFTL